MIYMFFIGYIIGGIVGAFILACILLANKMCVVIKEKNKDEEIKALTKANENLKVLYQDIVTQSEWHDEDYKKEIERLKKELKREQDNSIYLEEIKNKAIEYIEYYFAKGRTKNHKQFDLSLYEILTGKNLFNLTMKEIEQFFKGVDKE